MSLPSLAPFRILYAGFSLDLLFRYTALFLLNPVSASRQGSAPVLSLPAPLLVEHVYAWGYLHEDDALDEFF